MIPSVAGVYSPRHPERTVLYRVLFHYFERFLRHTWSRRNSSQNPRLRPIIFHDFLLDQGGEVWLIFGIFYRLYSSRGVLAHQMRLPIALDIYFAWIYISQ